MVGTGEPGGSRPAREGLNALLADGAYLDFVRALRACPASADPEGILTRAGIKLPAATIAEVQNAPDDAAALYALGTEIWATDGGEMEGIFVLGRAAELGSVPAIAALGESLHWMGDDSRAIPLLKRAVEHPATRSSWLEGLLGEALLLAGEADEADPLLQSSYETHAEFGLPLAKIRLAAGQREEARRILEGVAAKGVYGAVLLLGNLLDEAGETEAAISAYHVGITQGDAHSAYNLGVLLLDRGDTEGARMAFEAARSMGDLTAPPAI